MKWLIIGLILIWYYKSNFSIKKFLRNLIIALRLWRMTYRRFREKNYCAYCKYFVKDSNKSFCLKHAQISDSPIDVSIHPNECERFNSYNNCKDYKFDIFWWLK